MGKFLRVSFSIPQQSPSSSSCVKDTAENPYPHRVWGNGFKCVIFVTVEGFLIIKNHFSHLRWLPSFHPVSFRFMISLEYMQVFYKYWSYVRASWQEKAINILFVCLLMQHEIFISLLLSLALHCSSWCVLCFLLHWNRGWSSTIILVHLLFNKVVLENKISWINPI